MDKPKLTSPVKANAWLFEIDPEMIEQEAVRVLKEMSDTELKHLRRGIDKLAAFIVVEQYDRRRVALKG